MQPRTIRSAGPQDTMRYTTAALIIFFVFLSGCSGPDRHLQQLARDVYAQKSWEPPLPPNEFRSDGCSLWPDYDWLKCCVEHDVVYWLGGTREERKEADRTLEKCVGEKGHPFIGKIMYYGVQAGGVYWLPTPFRWGFGWSYPQSGPPGTQY
ncbi:MAG: hypothetical protein SCH71_14240 [Desulfobulbaceae bacterium]|nr:hypothetical protein [Desulfobulbaceae bacterium]